ncbi:recombinase family protein [Paenarthrobacter sp. PH39-S1]|uniref:recombinase family protein n=1 Tax=Paenarthrobacter sp. PH39-S1 TaxID=3046204 RepID=UPI0024BAC8FA|nr:recombinase family protein [Paenarthrobacter sp. PH39-S1]MDJ0358222.1 recombinase family protein [Paenarthrobacter sp. PH39-S1]
METPNSSDSEIAGNLRSGLAAFDQAESASNELLFDATARRSRSEIVAFCYESSPSAPDLRERGVGLRVLEQGIDTTTAEGRAMFGMLSVLAEFQRELIIANTRDGLAAARARGRTGGRRPKLTPDQPTTPNSSTTPGITPFNRSRTCSVFPARRSTATSTAPGSP